MAFPPAPSPRDLAAALEQAAARFAALLRRVPDAARPAVGTWTVGETAAHASGSASFFLASARGEAPPEPLAETAANNTAFLAQESERDPAVLADRFLAGERRLLAFVAEVDGDPTLEVFAGVHAPFSTLLAVELAEVLVHGFDIARAFHLPWPLGRTESALAVAGLLPLLPHMLDRQAAAGFRARIELRVRGGTRAILQFGDGGLQIATPDGGPVDCRLTVDPAAYLLLSYFRIGQWKPALTGKLLPWGRRPWLAARLASLFQRI